MLKSITDKVSPNLLDSLPESRGRRIYLKASQRKEIVFACTRHKLKDGAAGDLSSRAIHRANHPPRHLIRRGGVKRGSVGIVPRLLVKTANISPFFPSRCPAGWRNGRMGGGGGLPPLWPYAITVNVYRIVTSVGEMKREADSEGNQA